VSFETEFFGPGNRLRWEAIQAGSLPAEVWQRLGPFVEDLEHDREIVALPRVREEGGDVLWYVLCSSPRTVRIARDEVQAFLGPTYSNFEGRPSQFDPNDPVEAAVIAKYQANAFRVEIPDRNIFEIARERLGLLIRLEKERPPRHGTRIRAAGRVLRDFEYALLTNQEAAATACIEELRSAGQLSAANLLFLEVRKLATGHHWDAILALPALQELLSVTKPRRVTEALIRAVYSIHLKEFEENGRAEAALDRFRSEVWPRFRNLYQTRVNLLGFEVDASFLMAATCALGSPEIGRAVLDGYAPDSPARLYLERLLDLIRKPPSVLQISPVASAREAYAEGDIDRAYVLATNLSSSFDRTALLLRCAHEMSTLASAQAALESVESLSAPDRARLDQTLLLSRIRNSLAVLSAVETETTIPQRPAEEIPSSWPEWLNRLRAPDPWKGAVFVAETGAREWNIGNFLKDSNMVAETAELLLDDRPQWGQHALRDALPYFVEFCLTAGVDARLKPVYESLFLAVAVDPQVSLPQTAALIRIAQARLELGVSRAEYVEILEHVISTLRAAESPSVADLALEALEMLVNAVCPDVEQRQQFAIQVIAIFLRWYKRVDRVQIALLGALAEELEMADAMGDLAKEVAEPCESSEWSQLEGKRIAMYSLQESALRRAALVIGELSRSRVDTFSDHVGGSAALRKAASSADIFIIATAAAKHAATTYIEDHRPKNLETLYARGQGSASLLEALREYTHSASRSSQ
jgi:hypothetical protein